MHFNTVAPTPMTFDAEIVTGAALMGAEPGTIDCNGHRPPAEEPDNQINHLPDIFHTESDYPTMDGYASGGASHNKQRGSDCGSCGLRYHYKSRLIFAPRDIL